MGAYCKSNLYKGVPNNILNNVSGIYIIKNLANGKVYVGCSKDLSARRRGHVNDLCRNMHKNKHLQHAYNKYGDNNFTFEVVEFLNKSTVELFEKESFYINKFNSTNPDFGYNIKDAELINIGQCKKVVCLETQKIYDSIKNASLDTGTQPSNIGSCCRGVVHTANNLHWMYYSDFIKLDKIDVQNILTKPRKHTVNKKVKVVCLENSRIFNSLSDAEKFANVSKNCITKACIGKTKTAGGFHWMHYKDFLNASKKQISDILEPPRPQAVRRTDTGQVYSSLQEASEQTGCSIRDIRRVCNKCRHTVHGIPFEFVN